MTSLPKHVPLFRREAVLNKADALFGSILLPSTRFESALSMVAGVAAVAVVALLFVGSYTERVQAVGWLTPADGLSRIVSPRSGVVTEVRVQEGSYVNKGDELVVIASSRASSTSTDIEEGHLEQLRSRRVRLSEQIEAQAAFGTRERNRLNRELQKGGGDVGRLQVLQELAVEQRRLATENLARDEKVFSAGLISAVQVERSRAAVLDAQAAITNSEQRSSDKRQELAGLRAQLDNLPLQQSRALSALQDEVSELDQKISEVESAKDAVIKAPVSGHVASLAVHLGSQAAPGSLLFFLIPQGAPLEANLLVPTAASGLLQAGMPVKVRYDSYPYQKFGQYSGQVSVIGGSALSSEEQSQISPFHLDRPAYLVRVHIDQQAVTAYGRDYPLRPGITLNVDIAHSKRRIYEWILNPLYAAGRSL